MMQRPAYEIEIGHLTEAVTDMLARDRDEVFQDLLHEIGTDQRVPARQRAEVANCIVVLCRRLTEQIRRYERLCWWEKSLDEDQNCDDDIPFGRLQQN